MPSKSPRAALLDISENAKPAAKFVAGMDFDAFAGDLRTIYAVTRCLEIISEATRRLSTAVKTRHPDMPWTDIAAAGNIYRYEYEDVEVPILWRTVTHSLPSLLAAAEEELRQLSP